MRQNHLELLLQYSQLGSTPRISDSVALGGDPEYTVLKGPQGTLLLLWQVWALIFKIPVSDLAGLSTTLAVV